MADDDSYRLFQQELCLRPETGTVIPGGGGIRKIRWNSPGKGKRGGLRVIYYYKCNDEVIYFLYAYRKNEAENLTQEQLKILCRLVKENLK